MLISLDLQSSETSMKYLKRDFMTAAIQEGKSVFNHLRKTDGELMGLILTTLRQEARAAFWLTSEMDKNGFTPLQQLNRGRREDVVSRLNNYIPPRLR